MARPITSLQVLCDRCHDWIRDSDALGGAATWPGEAMNAVHPALWLLVRQLCEVIGYDPSDLHIRPVENGALALPDDIELPRELDDALDAAVASIGSATTRRVCGSKIFWGRRLVQIAVAVTRNYNTVAATAKVTRQRGRRRQDDPNQFEPSHERPAAAPVPSPRFSENLAGPLAIPVAMAVPLDQQARSAPAREIRATFEQRDGTLPVVLEGDLADAGGAAAQPRDLPDGDSHTEGVVGIGPATDAPHRVSFAHTNGGSRAESKEALSIGSVARDSFGTQARQRHAASDDFSGSDDLRAQIPADVDPPSVIATKSSDEDLGAGRSKVDVPFDCDSNGALDISTDGDSHPPMTPRGSYKPESAIDKFSMPRARISHTHHSMYGEASEPGLDQEPGNPIGEATLDPFGSLMEGSGDQLTFGILDARERGYEALPPSFLRVRDLCLQTLGAISVEGSARGNSLSIVTISTTIDRVDVKKHFSTLFEDLVEDSFGRQFLQQTGEDSNEVSLTRLQELGTGRSESLLSTRIGGREVFETSSLTNLLKSKSLNSVSELKGAAKRSARLTANKPTPTSSWHWAVLAVLRQFGRSQVRVASVFGAAGSGKSTMMAEINKILTDSYVKKRDPNIHHRSYHFFCQIFDFSRPNELARLRHWIVYTREQDSDRSTRYTSVRFCIIDECTFFEPDGFELLSELDYVIFVGDPRQMGAVDNAHLIRQCVTLAGGSNQLLDKVHRRIHPALFAALNELAYEGKFSLATTPETVTRDPYQLTTCHDSKFCIAAAMLCMAFYNAADMREVCIATQDIDIVDWMKALIDLDPRAYAPLTSKISIVPLSRIQGLETDVLVINPDEIDRHCFDVAGPLKFLFVILGRVRQHLAIVQPLRTPVPIGDSPPPFSFLLHGLLGEMVKSQQ